MFPIRRSEPARLHARTLAASVLPLGLTIALGLGRAAPAPAAPAQRSTLAASEGTVSVSTQQVVVSAPTYSSTSATLTDYQFTGGSWHVAFGPVTAELGIGGLSDHHLEGDGTTPTGTYPFGQTMYGLGPALNSRYGYHTLVCGDYWSGVEDATYNTFVHVPCGQSLANSEALWVQTVAYQHFAVIDYNTNPIVLGQGSGIFLHDDTTSGVTAGCVAIPPTTLNAVLGWLDPAQNPVIRIGTIAEVGPPTPLFGDGSPLVEYTEQGGQWSGIGITPNGGIPVRGGGVPFVDPVTGFENAYAVSPQGHLVEYTRFPTGYWLTADLTALAGGPQVAPGAKPFVDPLTGFQNVYTTAASGDVIEYTRLPAGNWVTADLTTAARGPTVIGNPQPFTDPLTGFQNVYATSTRGQLIELTRLPAGDWVTDDLTAATGGWGIAGSARPFVDPLTGFQNVYATGTSAALVEFTRLPAGNWIVANLTGLAGGPAIVGTPAPFTDPVTGFQNAYARTAAGHLIEFTRIPTGNWIAFDVSGGANGPPVTSNPAPFDAGSTQLLFAVTSAGHLVDYARSAGGDWGITDLTAASGAPPVFADPAPTIDPLTFFLNVYDS